VRLFPYEFKRRYAEETKRVFGDDCLDTYTAGGCPGLAALWLRTLLDIVRSAISEHVASCLAEHPGTKRGIVTQVLTCAGLVLGILAVFITDESTPPEVPMAVLYGCLLFAAGALLRPTLALFTCAATVGVYMADAFVAPGGWTSYRLLGLLPILVGGLWALRTGADQARLRAKSVLPVSDEARQVLEELLAHASDEPQPLPDDIRRRLTELLDERCPAGS
jgi:hypothetical protein